MKVCQQQGRTCGQVHVVALYTEIALKYMNNNMGRAMHEMLERIADRDNTVRAWVKLCIARNRIAPLDWIDQLANLSNNTTAHSELQQLLHEQQSEAEHPEPIGMVAQKAEGATHPELIELISQETMQTDENDISSNQLPPPNAEKKANTDKGKKKKGKKGKGKRRLESKSTGENDHPNKKSKVEPTFKVDMKNKEAGK